jgi:tRNA(Ile)-lysidine synthase
MLRRVKDILQQFRVLDAGKPLLLGVSGGPDSLAMLDLLSQLETPLVAAHLNHTLRPESTQEAEAVRRAAEERGAAFVLEEADVAAYARDQLLSVEEAARILRYRFLFNQAHTHKAAAVLVAHTADDQVETVLMHLLRGAGLSGLKGMEAYLLPNPWDDQIPLIRPLLGMWREEVLQYCQDRGLEPVLDPSNLDTRYYRNRLRSELIPYLETYNPQVRRLIWRTAQVLGGDHAVLEVHAESAWQRAVVAQGQGYLGLNIHKVLQEMEGARRRVVRRAVAQLRPGLRDIDFELVERFLRCLEGGPSPTRCDLGAGLSLLVEAGTVWLAAWESDLPGADFPQAPEADQGCPPLSLPLPGDLSMPEGWQITSRVVEDAPAAYPNAVANADPYQAWLDLDTLHLPLQVRCRRAGDRFLPLGMQGHSMKLSDFMINLKLPSRLRSAWPLVCSADEIAWIPGLRLAHPYRLKPDSLRAVHLHITRISQAAGE